MLNTSSSEMHFMRAASIVILFISHFSAFAQEKFYQIQCTEVTEAKYKATKEFKIQANLDRLIEMYPGVQGNSSLDKVLREAGDGGEKREIPFKLSKKEGRSVYQYSRKEDGRIYEITFNIDNGNLKYTFKDPIAEDPASEVLKFKKREPWIIFTENYTCK